MVPLAARAEPPPEVVRAHFRAPKVKKAVDVFEQKSDGSVTLVCRAPCVANVVSGSELLVAIGDGGERYPMVVPRDMAGEVDVTIKGPESGPRVAGIVALASGPGLIAAGVLTVSFSMERFERGAGYTAIGVGAASIVAGTILLLARFRAPRVEVTPRATRENDAPPTKPAEAAALPMPLSGPIFQIAF